MKIRHACRTLLKLHLKAYQGRTLAILRASAAGEITLTARDENPAPVTPDLAIKP